MFNSPTGGFPLGRSPLNFLWVSTDGQGTKCRRNIAENYNRLSRVHERYRRQTDRETDDRRQTDGRQHIANVNVSSRSLKTSTTLQLHCVPKKWRQNKNQWPWNCFSYSKDRQTDTQTDTQTNRHTDRQNCYIRIVLCTDKTATKL